MLDSQNVVIEFFLNLKIFLNIYFSKLSDLGIKESKTLISAILKLDDSFTTFCFMYVGCTPHFFFQIRLFIEH